MTAPGRCLRLPLLRELPGVPGAVSSAEDYGTALSTCQLNRFALGRQLHVPPRRIGLVEKERNERLVRLLSGRSLYVRYEPQRSDLHNTGGAS